MALAETYNDFKAVFFNHRFHRLTQMIACNFDELIGFILFVKFV